MSGVEAAHPPAVGVDAPSPAAPDAQRAAAGRALRGDVVRAVSDAAKLGASLMGTWAIGLVVRIYMPRHLGPAAFGGFQFADAFTGTLFIFASLGIDTYVRKEVATRRDHASEFFGGTLLLRVLLGALALAAGVVGLRLSGRHGDVLHLVVLFGVVQLLATVNSTYAAMLHAVGRVDGFSFWNVVSKLVWAAGIGLAVALGGGATAVAAAVVASELLRTAALAVLARRQVGLRFRVDVAASLGVVRASLPFFVGGVAQTLYSRVDVSIMAFLASPTEVGWYGAVQTLAGISLLLSPLIGWVLLPLTSRAAARSEAELMFVTRRAMEVILAVAFPASLFLYLSAEPLVRLAFGAEYAPAAPGLRVLAPTLLLTYAAMVSASVLVRLERGWAVTWVTLGGMAISPALNFVLVPHGLRTLGPGGAGVGAATALVVTELYTAVSLTWLIGRGSVDRRLAGALARTLAVCAAVVVLDRLLAPYGAWRLAADAAAYVAGVVATGAVRVGEVVALARGALGARRARGAEGTLVPQNG
jgi:O-antigen/teichoic acid export membrane protein